MFLFLNPKFHILRNNNFSLLTSTRNNIKKISIPPKHTSPFSLLISERFNERKATRKSEFRHSKDDVDAGIRALPSGVSAPPDPDQEEEEEDRNSLPLPSPPSPNRETKRKETRALLELEAGSERINERNEKLVCCSGAKGTSAAVAAVAARPAGPVRPDERGRRGVREPQRPLVPLLVHKPAAQGGTLPDLALRPVHAAQQHHGDRQHMRAGRPVALLGGRVGEEHPVLPRPPGHRPGSPSEASVERAVRAQREPVLDAAPRGAPPRRRRPPRLPHGGGPRRRLHGPHQDLSGASGEAQGPPRRLRRVQLPQGHRPLHHRSDLFPLLFSLSFSSSRNSNQFRRVSGTGIAIWGGIMGRRRRKRPDRGFRKWRRFDRGDKSAWILAFDRDGERDSVIDGGEGCHATRRDTRDGFDRRRAQCPLLETPVDRSPSDFIAQIRRFFPLDARCTFPLLPRREKLRGKEYRVSIEERESSSRFLDASDR